MVRGDITFEAEKFVIDKDDGSILISAGMLCRGRELMGWFLNRDEKKEFPEPKGGEDGLTFLIVAKPGEGVRVYEDSPYGEDFTKIFPMAWGSGEEVALGVMLYGGNSNSACKIAGSINIMCGGQIDTFEIFP